MDKTYLALDVGLSYTGYAVYAVKDAEFFAAGLLRPKHKAGLEPSVMLGLLRRCNQLHLALTTLLDKYQPQIVYGEFPVGGGRSSQAVRNMCMASAVIGVTCRSRKIPLTVVSPHAVKKLVSGETSKQAIIDEVSRRHPELIPFLEAAGAQAEHIADAAGCLLVSL